MVTGIGQKNPESIKKKTSAKQTMRKTSLLSLVLGATLWSCSAVKQEIKNEPKSSLEYVVNICPFNNFDPPSAGKMISIEGPLRPYVFDGFDMDVQSERESMKIKDYVAFENKIYETAQQIGYAKEKVNAMTPKETLELVAKIVARTMNYFGMREDYSTNKEETERIERLKKIFDTVQKNSALGGDLRIAATRDAGIGSELLEEFIEERRKLDALQDKLSDLGGTLTSAAGFDEEPPSELFLKGEPIVCRHYAAIARDIYFMLQVNNSKLRNTHVSMYSYKNHKWNQVTTLYEKEGKLHIDIAFFDPTWYDCGGNSEAFNPRHFGHFLELTYQQKKFETAIKDIFYQREHAVALDKKKE